MSRFLALSMLILFSMAASAQSLVVSTHPVFLIAQEVTKGVEEPVLLLKDQTGHDVTLTPAHRKAIMDASLVIWLGKAHEAPLEKVLGDNQKAVALLDSGIMTALPQRSARGTALKNTVDTHVWLDPNNAVRIAFFIAALRSQQMPENKEKYWSNARVFSGSLLQAAQKHSTTATAKPYWSYHDAYQYLERVLNLKFAGALTEDPHVAPSIAQIKYLNDSRPMPRMCLLAEGHAGKNQYGKLAPVVFQVVDENMSGSTEFISAWKTLADHVQGCVLNARK
ncbi:metal ABC transporter solute-binding protein, Zn/Mn family [Acinetobacter chinensis]|uniref:metal ABC transporter solute-binding protein, Zn/Mn family n=1 Tax=Acinetobacter chinensis TaxID=2004650 RepID=UPI0029350B08|nr:zinc ABC transporter substrate-binding protein [Acinetobacter chinensis]WOE41719.1 zinc ABC transporter substrate-binding protein [Acinetobacter chinensis]